MSAPVIDGNTFTYADVEGDTINAVIGTHGLVYVRNETADQGTSVTVVLTSDVATALGRFIASVFQVKWTRNANGHYTSGEYTIFREGVNSTYPWAIKRGTVLIDLAPRLREAKSMANADRAYRASVTR